MHAWRLFKIMLFLGFGDFKTISPSSLILPKMRCCLCEDEKVQFVAVFPQKVSFILCGYKPFFSSVNTQLRAKYIFIKNIFLYVALWAVLPPQWSNYVVNPFKKNVSLQKEFLLVCLAAKIKGTEIFSELSGLSSLVKSMFTTLPVVNHP